MLRKRKTLCAGPKKQKPCIKYAGLLTFRGDERIRTAVAAFAELSLATRPRHRIGIANIRLIRIISNIPGNFWLKNCNSFSIRHKKSPALKAGLFKIRY